MFSVSNQSCAEDLGAFQDDKEDTLRVVVAGEVRAGKSAFINVLARGVILPNLTGDLGSLPTVVRHSDTPWLGVKGEDGKISRIDDLNDPKVEGSSELLVGAQMPHLSAFEIVEVPFSHEEDVSDESLDLMNSADVLVWVTIGSQAWRLSEQSIVNKIDDGAAKHRLLVVSRADKLRSQTDREKIKGRLERETVDYFDKIFFMHGRGELITKSGQDEDAWEKTVGRTFFATLEELAAKNIPPELDDAGMNAIDRHEAESNIVELRPQNG